MSLVRLDSRETVYGNLFMLDDRSDSTTTEPGGGSDSPVTATEVRAQLKRIADHPMFKKGERMARFLAFLVEQVLVGRTHRIKQRTIALEVFGRDSDFDPRIDPIVRIEAMRLRRMLDEYYNNDGAPDPIQISVPKGRYVPSFRRRDPSLEKLGEQPATITTQHGGPSLAVAYFVNATADRDRDFICLGFTDELLACLSCFSELVVIGPLRQPTGDMDHALQARQAGAAFLLRGELQQFGENLRVSASLIEAKHGETLWAEHYDRDLSASQIFAIQDEIAECIVGTIADGFGVISRTLAAASKAQKTDSLTAYEAVLKMREWQGTLANDTLLKAKEALEHAVKMDSTYALAKAFLSDVYAIDYHLNLGLTGHPKPLDRAEELARDAVALDRYCQTSAWCLAAVHFHRRRRELCITELERTLSLNSAHPLSIANCGLFFTMLGERQRGVELIRKAMALNPHHPSWYHFCLYLDEYCRGRYERALHEAVRFQSHDLFWPPLVRAAALGQLGDSEAARAELRELLKRFPDFHELGPDVMRLTVYTDEHVAVLLDGLKKAGLEQPDLV